MDQEDGGGEMKTEQLLHKMLDGAKISDYRVSSLAHHITADQMSPLLEVFIIKRAIYFMLRDLGYEHNYELKFWEKKKK